MMTEEEFFESEMNVKSRYTPPHTVLPTCGCVLLPAPSHRALVDFLSFFDADGSTGFGENLNPLPDGGATLPAAYWRDLCEILLFLEVQHADRPSATLAPCLAMAALRTRPD